MSERPRGGPLAWCVTGLTLLLVVGLAVVFGRLVTARQGVTTVQLVAPPMAIVETHAEVWLTSRAPAGPPPPPGNRPPPPGMAGHDDLRREVSTLAVQLMETLDDDQQVVILGAREELSSVHGEVGVWEELVTTTGSAPSP